MTIPRDAITSLLDSGAAERASLPPGTPLDRPPLLPKHAFRSLHEPLSGPVESPPASPASAPEISPPPEPSCHVSHPDPAGALARAPSAAPAFHRFLDRRQRALEFLARPLDSRSTGSLRAPLPNLLMQNPYYGDKRFLYAVLQYAGGEYPIWDRTLLEIMRYVHLGMEAISYQQVYFTRLPQFLRIELDQDADYYKKNGGRFRIVLDARKKLEEKHDLNLDDFDTIIYVASREGYTGGGGASISSNEVFLGPHSTIFPTPLEMALIIIHEIGHTAGFEHSNMWDYRPKGGGPCAGPGAVLRSDEFDIMGDELEFSRGFPEQKPPRRRRTPHMFNPWYMLRIGWIKPSNVKRVDVEGKYKLDPLETHPGRRRNPLALKVPVAVNMNAWIFWRRYEKGNAGPLGEETKESLNNYNGPVITFEFNSTASDTLLYNVNVNKTITTSAKFESPVWEPAMEHPIKLNYAQSPLTVGETYYIYGPTDSTPPLQQPTAEQRPFFEIYYDGHNGNTEVTVWIRKLVSAPRPAPIIGLVPITMPSKPGRPLPSGHVTSGTSYTVTTYLPDGSTTYTNGHEIAKVEMMLLPSSDALGGAVFRGDPMPGTPRCVNSEPSKCWAHAVHHTPDYTLQPEQPPNAPPAGAYVLLVTATGTNGESTTVWWRHVLLDPMT